MNTSLRSHTSRVIMAAVVLALAMSAVQAQYTLDWYDIAGGGGTSTGGVYSVSGTIGQPDAGAMSGGGYSLVGGFWSVVAAVQAPGAPLLTIERRTTNSVTVSWPAPATGWALKENADMKTTNWVNVAQTPQEVGGRRLVVVPLPALPATKFYRLSYQP